MNMDDNSERTVNEVPHEEMMVSRGYWKEQSDLSSEISTSSDTDDEITMNKPHTVVFENKLVGFIIRREWQQVLDHLETKAGQEDSRSPAFAFIGIGEWMPLHVLFLARDDLPATLRPPHRCPRHYNGLDLLDETIFTLNQEHDTIIADSSSASMPPLEVVNALLTANSEALLTELRCGRQLLYYAMERRADKEVIRAMLVAEPTTLKHRGDDRSVLIHDMLDGLIFLETHLLLDYLKIVADVKPEYLLKRTTGGKSVMYIALSRFLRKPEIIYFLLQTCPQLASMPLQVDQPWLLPIHRVCNWGRISQVDYCKIMDAMIQAYPKCVIEPECDGCLPIHVNTKKLAILCSDMEKSQYISSVGDRIKAHQSLVHHTYHEVLRQLYPTLLQKQQIHSNCDIFDSPDTNTATHTTAVTGLHKAAWIAHLFFLNAREAHPLFQFTEELFGLTQDLVNNNHCSPYMKERVLQQDDRGNTFLNLLWNKAGKSAVIQKRWNRKKRSSTQWREYLVGPPNLDQIYEWNTRQHARITLYDEEQIARTPTSSTSDSNNDNNNDNDVSGHVTLFEIALSAIKDAGVSVEYQQRLIQTANQEQELPLHRALRYGRSNTFTEQEVRHLIDLFPDASRMADIHGALPLHLALRHQCPSKVYAYVSMLLRVHPAASAVLDVDPDQDHDKLFPFMLAAMKRGVHGIHDRWSSCLSSTFVLLQQDPSVLNP